MTDKCYTDSINLVLKTLADQLDTRTGRPQLALNIIFGTHNIGSLTEIFAKLEAEGLASKTTSGRLRVRSDAVGKVAIAQLYGRF